MKTKKIEVNYKPLSVHMAINEVGSVSSLQTYDAVTGIFEADYTLRHWCCCLNVMLLTRMVLLRNLI